MEEGIGYPSQSKQHDPRLQKFESVGMSENDRTHNVAGVQGVSMLGA